MIFYYCTNVKVMYKTTDLKNIRDYIAEDNEEYAAKTIKEIYGKFENLQMFPGMGAVVNRYQDITRIFD